MATLDQFLSRAYAAQHGLSKEKLEDVMADFATAAGTDDTLVPAAKARVASLTDEICARDHISSRNRNFLQLVLGS